MGEGAVGMSTEVPQSEFRGWPGFEVVQAAESLIVVHPSLVSPPCRRSNAEGLETVQLLRQLSIAMAGMGVGSASASGARLRNLWN